MKLRNIDFGPVMGASGVQGFFGEGYWYHRYLKAFCPGFSFQGMTFVAKTTTLERREGNMPLKYDGMSPRDLKPACIVVDIPKGIALNAVGLSGPGANALMDDGRWHKRTDTFMISFMSVGPTPEKRLEELEAFVKKLKRYILMRNLQERIALQINFSCPNVGLNPAHLIEEVMNALEAVYIGIPVIPKFNLLMPVEAVMEIAKHLACDAICISNTIPWGTLKDRIDWKGLFGTEESPLKQFGGGGLSGAPLLPLLEEWLDKAIGKIPKPLIAGGGILGPDNVRMLSRYPNVKAVSLGSIVMLRPWRLKSTIKAAHKYIAP